MGADLRLLLDRHYAVTGSRYFALRRGDTGISNTIFDGMHKWISGKAIGSISASPTA